MGEVIALLLIVGLVIFGAYCGILIYRDALLLQDQLTKFEDVTLEFDGLSVLAQVPQRVRATNTYTLRVYLDESLLTAPRTFDESDSVTLFIHGDLRFIEIIGSAQVTTTVPLSTSLLAQPPQIFTFRVRDDVKELPDELDIAIGIVPDPKIVLEDKVIIPVYHEGDFSKQHWWHFVFFSLTALVAVALIIVLIAVAFAANPVAGAIVLVLVVLVGMRVYPPLKQIIETITPFLKFFF